jgi:hypothetical protein
MRHDYLGARNCNSFKKTFFFQIGGGGEKLIMARSIGIRASVCIESGTQGINPELGLELRRAPGGD